MPSTQEVSQSDAVTADSTKEMTNEANSTTVEAAGKASDGAATERGVDGGRGNTDYTVFVSNLPFNATADELREKFKHVSLNITIVCQYHPSCMSLLPLVCVCHCYPLCMSFYPSCVSMLPLFAFLYDAYGCHWLQCGDIADIRMAHKHIRGRACKFGYVEFQSKVSNNNCVALI